MMHFNAKGEYLPLINKSIQNTNDTPIRVILENDINQNFYLTTLFTSVLAGFFTGMAIIGSDEFLHWRRKPKISLDSFHIITREFNINAYQIDEPIVPPHLLFFPVKYIANRIKVLNDGSTAAEESKGAFRIRSTKNQKIDETEVKPLGTYGRTIQNDDKCKIGRISGCMCSSYRK